MKVTIKFLKEWGQHLDGGLERREAVQRALDGGGEIMRMAEVVEVHGGGVIDVFVLESPGRAVKFAAALNMCRRPLRLIKEDLDRDWAARVKARDRDTCVLCGVTGDKTGATVPARGEADDPLACEGARVKARVKKDVLTAHHWLKTKARAGMARWCTVCGVTVHFAEHIHILHENPCWADLDKIYRHVVAVEGGMTSPIETALSLSKVSPTEKAVRELWRVRIGTAGPLK